MPAAISILDRLNDAHTPKNDHEDHSKEFTTFTAWHFLDPYCMV